MAAKKILKIEASEGDDLGHIRSHFFFSGEELEGDSLPGAGTVPQLAAAPAPLAVPAAGLEALAPELLQTPGSTVQLQDAAQLKGGVDFFS